MINEALWALGRGTGITALLLLTITVALGIATRSGRTLFGLPRFAVQSVHQFAALTSTLLVALHVGTMIIDPYAQVNLIDAVVPFGSAYRGLWVGLGTLALDLLIVVIVSSLLRNRLGPSVFRALHWATYALWPLAFVHTLGSGTDVGQLWMITVCAVCALVVGAAVTVRLRTDFAEYQQTRLQPAGKAIPR